MESEKRIFYRKLWGLVFPIAIQNLMTALVSASDALCWDLSARHHYLLFHWQHRYSLYIICLCLPLRLRDNSGCAVLGKRRYRFSRGDSGNRS